MTFIAPRNAEEFALVWRREHRGFPVALMMRELSEKFGITKAREVIGRLQFSDSAVARFEKLRNKLKGKL